MAWQEGSFRQERLETQWVTGSVGVISIMPVEGWKM